MSQGEIVSRITVDGQEIYNATDARQKREDRAIEEAIERAVAVLNEARLLDPLAMAEMFSRTVIEVNEAVARHPAIQVYRSPGELRYWMTPLGLINGILGCNERTGYVAKVGSLFVHHRPDTGNTEEVPAA